MGNSFLIQFGGIKPLGKGQTGPSFGFGGCRGDSRFGQLGRRFDPDGLAHLSGGRSLCRGLGKDRLHRRAQHRDAECFKQNTHYTPLFINQRDAQTSTRRLRS